MYEERISRIHNKIKWEAMITFIKKKDITYFKLNIIFNETS